MGKIIFSRILCMLALFLLLPFSAKSATVCTPASAYMCAAVDDEAWVYINGIYVDYFPYVNWDQTGVYPKCVTLTAGQISSLNPTGNVLALKDMNTNCCEIWASWSLDITCQSGQHSYVTSDDGSSISMWHDTRGCQSATTPYPDPTEASTPVATRIWYDPLYVEGTSGLSWVAPTVVTGQKWGKRIWDPQSGALLPALGYSTTSPAALNDCQQLFYRQGFSLPVEPTPAPPNFTIQKSAGITNGICQQCSNGTNPLTFTLVICNTGGGTFGNPVTVTDEWSDNPDNNWQFQGPTYDYYDPVVGNVHGAGTGETASWVFNEGFPENYCWTWWWILQTWNPSTLSITWHNNATVLYQSTPYGVSTVTLRDATPTATPTFTRTATPSVTPTRTMTPAAPILSLTKTGNPTTGLTGNQTIQFTLVMCNTGGYIPDSFFVTDTWNSPDSWSFSGPYGYSLPITAYSGGPPTNFTFGGGFPGGACFTWNYQITSYSAVNPANWCATWQNSAAIVYRTTPSIVATLNLVNVCPSSTFTRTPTPSRTVTNTPLPGTQTFTPTYSRTMTYTWTRTITTTWTHSPTPPPGSPTHTPTFTRTFTITPSFTPTVTMTPTTPALQIALTKTVPQNIYILGDTITYCLSFRNNGTGPASFVIWDTIPAVTDFLSCNTGSNGYATGCSPMTIGSDVLVIWNIVGVPAGGTDTVCFNVSINRLPYLPGVMEYFAMLDERKQHAYGRNDIYARRWQVLTGDYFSPATP